MGDIERRPPIFMGSFFLGHPVSQHKPYDYQSALGTATTFGTYTGLAGTIVAAIKHGVITPTEAHKGYLGNILKLGAMTAAVGFTYGGVSQFVASVRQESDPWNAAAGGCASGFLVGLRAGQLPLALGQCFIFGSAAAGVNYAGGTLIPANHNKTKEQQQLERTRLLGDKPDPLLVS
ncbi:hypothetical protein O181_002392 [Austropuccinia psidii MF-1]|uniref:NADH dehydrogenase [ubiquinone] 1 alpha subcomplex subunit 11 n=1 Tax=Austropuccinia psidii MF-1 TaxID=1389203 RepID=A0A9Q3BCQ2_9BASI|nr:hypothetical protein [Austropuccinia psidii MF-1]